MKKKITKVIIVQNIEENGGMILTTILQGFISDKSMEGCKMVA